MISVLIECRISLVGFGETPMLLQYQASSHVLINKPVAAGPIFVRMTNSEEISPTARVALAAADVVFCDDDADRGVVALTSPGALVEFVAVNGAGAWSRPLSIARARRLACDGWRVVWITSVNVDLPPDCEQADCAVEAGAPYALATAFNGLAG
jgi:hypothetical protein